MQGRIRQDGFVILLMALFLTVSAAALLSVYDAGLLTTRKTHLQQVTDAGAYSAAVLQARELNFHAWMNRGMIANQVLIAQSVSLSSFMQLNQQFFHNLARAGDLLVFIPGIGPAIKALTTYMEQFGGVLNFALQHALNVTVGAADELTGLLSAASRAWSGFTLLQLGEQIPAMVHAQMPQAQFGLIGGAAALLDARQWQDFTRLSKASEAEKQHAARSEDTPDRDRMLEFAAVTLASAPDFVHRRDDNFWNFFGYFEFRQRGGTTLGKLKGKKLPLYSWSALDTLSIWTGIFNEEMEIPFAWGRQATYHKNRGFDWWEQEQDYSSWAGANRVNRAAWEFTQNRDRYNSNYFEGPRNTITHIAHFKVDKRSVNEGFGLHSPGGVEGLRPFMDLAEDNILRESRDRFGRKTQRHIVDAAPALHIVLQTPLSSLPLSGSKLPLRDESPLQLLPPDGERWLTSIASARAVFSDPQAIPRRGQASLQLASLYSPYWEARLSPVTRRTEIEAVLAVRGAR